MKKIFIAALFTVLFTACQRSSNDVVSPNTPPTPGNWKVSYYWDKKDETSNFNGWSIRFNTGGTALATNGSNTATGTWSKSNTRFSIDFGSHATLGSINNNWLIISFSSNNIQLKDDNPQQDDQLHLSL